MPKGELIVCTIFPSILITKVPVEGVFARFIEPETLYKLLAQAVGVAERAVIPQGQLITVTVAVTVLLQPLAVTV